MSIEVGSAVVSVKAVTGDTTRMAKGKGPAGSTSDLLAGFGTGFSALLSSLESVPVAEDGSVPQQSKDEPVLDLQPPVDPLLNFLPQVLPNDLQLLLAQASEVSVDKSNLLQVVAQGTELSAPMMRSTPTIASIADVVPGLTLASVAQGLPGSEPTLPLLAAKVDVASPDPKAVNGDGVSNPQVALAEVALPADVSLLQPGQGTQTVRPSKSKMGEILSGPAASMADPRTLTSAALTDVAKRETAVMGALVSSGYVENVPRLGDRRSDKSSFTLAGSGVEGMWGQTPFQSGPGVETATLTAGSSASPLEAMVAETVSYWVTQGVKHAALKLEGFGEQPLEVNISMQGGETHIDFRTDLPEVRQILEGAMMHLKDVLKGEGVVLSGVSVGSSGQNSGGNQDERNRPGARQGAVVTTRPLSADSRMPVSLPAGRVLDLFV